MKLQLPTFPPLSALLSRLLPPSPIPSAPSARLTNTANSILLFNTRSQKFSHLSVAELSELRKRKGVWPVPVPVCARRIDVSAAGGMRDVVCERVELPRKVVLGRMLGWWDVVWVVEEEGV
jgi:hypothetical protein